MATIPDRVIEEVRDRADVVDVIGEVVTLKKRGKNWVGLCPFHPEKTPSFNVTPDKQMYYCFGCQAGGNVFTFLMEYERLDFPSAVRALAERTGVEIPEEPADAGPDPFAPLRHANRLAAEFYHRRLLSGGDAAEARDYLTRRGIDRDHWETFLLGWAPESWEALTEEATRQGIPEAVLLEAGLIARSEKTSGVYDRFRGRVVFPIRALGGEVVGFSGRRLDAEEPKYLNSPDTPVFAKGRMLFNLDLARAPIRRAGAAVVVEGNFDVVTLYAAGFRNVVAPLGTALTGEQARVLRRYTGTAYLAYDGDRAGERAAFRAADVLLGAGFAVRILPIPAGEDPDALVRVRGATAFEDRLQASTDVVDAMIAVIAERIDLGDVVKKRRAIRRLLETVARIPDAMTRALYLDKIASNLHVPRETLELPAPAPPRVRPRASRPPTAPVARATAPKGVVLPQIQEERYVLLHAVHDPRWLAEAVAACRPEFFSVEAYRRFFERLCAVAAEDPEEAGEWMRRSAERDDQRVLAELEHWRDAQGFELTQDAFRDSVRRLQLKALERGLLPVPSTGDPLYDAVKRGEIERDLLRGRATIQQEGIEHDGIQHGGPELPADAEVK
ncbi:MAG: DNA primase [Gemmatimonadota bacterium]